MIPNCSCGQSQEAGIFYSLPEWLRGSPNPFYNEHRNFLEGKLARAWCWPF